MIAIVHVYPTVVAAAAHTLQAAEKQASKAGVPSGTTPAAKEDPPATALQNKANGSFRALRTQSLDAASAKISGILTAAVTNGVINASMYPGATIDAKVAAAVAANCAEFIPDVVGPSCTIVIPQGTYTYSSAIVLPEIRNITLIGAGAYLNYTGSGYAIEVSPGADHFFITGIDLNGNPSAKGGIAIGRGIQGAYLSDLRVHNFANGDGIINYGANVGLWLRIQSSNNEFGIHLTGSPGFASNAIHIAGSTLTNNRRWGYISGDVARFPVGWYGGPLGASFSTAGTSSPEFNNSVTDSDLEGNNTGFGTGAILSALTVSESFVRNYFEGTPGNEIVFGQNGAADADYSRLYKIAGPQGGTAVSPKAEDNYFTPAGGTSIYLDAALGAIVTGNGMAATTPTTADACFLSVNVAVRAFVNNNTSTARSMFCQGATPESPDAFAIRVGPSLFDNAIATAASTVYFGASGDPEGAPGAKMIRFDNAGPPTPANPSNRSTFNTKCTPAWALGSMWIDGSTGNWWQCLADTQLAVPIHDGQGTWVKK